MLWLNKSINDRQCNSIGEVMREPISHTLQKLQALVNAIDEKGNIVRLSLSNCLISPLFPYRLLSVNAFTSKGHTVTFAQDQVRITNPVNDAVLLADRDSASQLMLLRQANPARTILQNKQMPPKCKPQSRGDSAKLKPKPKPRNANFQIATAVNREKPKLLAKSEREWQGEIITAASLS